MTYQSILISLVALILLQISGPLSAQSASQQVKASLAVIDTLDDQYNAVIQIDPSVQLQAQALDTGSSILAGMPILVKDNIDIVGMPTTAGSLALTTNLPVKDAPLIAQIKQAGGVILGKTNLSEWANFRSEKSSSGWSAVGGQTFNAHDRTRSPCGSSSGSGVAVALGYVKVAIGTETHGSIVCPATANGVVGFKPTHGIVSGEGIVPLASSQDTAGPLADTISNAALVLSTMLDPQARNHDAIVSGLRSLNSGPSLEGLKIGVQANTLGYDPRRDALFELALNKLESAGAVIVHDISLSPYETFWDENYQLLKYEFRRDLNAYLASRPSPTNELSLEKLIAFNKQYAKTELRHFDQSIFEASHALELSESDYLAIRDRGHKATREDGLDNVFKQHGLDVLIGITGGPAWKIDYINGDSFFGPGMAGYPAIGGHPHVTVPGGKIVGMPMGLSFVGQRHQDHRLAQIVYRFMQL